ncbi:WhiB family transcriptional regulator [Actinomadura pelletieri]|uniref:WhiB family transcriptional regulator n=1 Tax=Actinomadura pelletieri TaxID=111805 RepID=UPI001FE262D6|nr:WhiB family transcriptional regulator [Actinomadura pelletieri]
MKLDLSAAWHALAACRGVDPDAFFVRPSDRAGVAAAKRICAGCPVREECLRYAVADEALEGIWGGMTDRERTATRLRTRLARDLLTTTPA